MSEPLISLVIPAYNEAVLLPRLLDSVQRARTAFHAGAAAIEVIVADNGSTDATVEIARAHGCRIASTPVRRIGAVRNAGAALACGTKIAFVDADASIHPDSFNEIERLLHTGRYVAGATGVALERWSAGIACTYVVLVSFVWLTGMDTGLVFCRREDLAAVGGYRENMRFAEDVMMLVDLRRLGRKRGQKLVRARRIKAIGSMRKFDEHGDWHYFALMGGGILRGLGLKDTDRFSEYWYKPRR